MNIKFDENGVRVDIKTPLEDIEKEKKKDKIIKKGIFVN